MYVCEQQKKIVKLLKKKKIFKVKFNFDSEVMVKQQEDKYCKSKWQKKANQQKQKRKS